MNSAQTKSAPCPERFCERIAVICCANTGDNIKPNGRGQNQLFGSIPRCCSSFRTIRLSHADKDSSPSCCCADSIISRNSGSNRNWKGGFPRLSFLCVDTLATPLVMYLCVITHYIQDTQKATPRTAETVPGRLTTNVNASNEAAMQNHTQTHPKFQYRFRFLALCATGSAIIHITAPDEHAAREMSPAGFVMVFAARLPAEAHHA